MKSTYLLLLASLTCGNLMGSRGQGAPATEDGMLDHRTIDDIILQKAETILLRYILEKKGEDGDTNEGLSSKSDCVTKRQHPGKRLTAEEEEEEEEQQPEKRQHPGRREEEQQQQQQEEQEQKEGHPGEQDEDSEYEAVVQKRQHPGRRRAVGLQGHGQQANLPGSAPVMLLMSELSKRQHPGKRFLAFFSKRQHPGKRDVGDKEELEEEQEEEEEQEQEEQGALQLQQQFDKRQHPGKRFWGNSGPDSGSSISSSSSSSRLCGGLETSSSSSSSPSSPGCSIRTSLLLDLLHHVAQEKRQHPGKRLAASPEEEDLVEKK
ncbi:hypothetical protein CRUP_017985 [Coryphaenoides rupestris]|nr:hypothetical protein CRUP_017985 [Coryphaenoides rupestris]